MESHNGRDLFFSFLTLFGIPTSSSGIHATACYSTVGCEDIVSILHLQVTSLKIMRKGATPDMILHLIIFLLKLVK